MPWPIEPVKLRHFCEGLDEVLVVEERREIIENQIKQYLFNWRADVRPRIIGKFDHQDRPVLPLDRELTVGLVAEVLAAAHPPARGRARDRRPHRGQARLVQGAERAGRASTSRRSAGRPISAPAAPTTPRPACPRAAAPWPASAATSWRSGWTGAPRPSPTWAPKACPGSAPRRSPTKSTSSSISAMAPISTPASSRSARRSLPASTSPTRSCSTMRSR